ncbi:YncE family protein [Phenylobacterium sp.]|jgi:DNA-binding beta-propeller fold protein YncE|uniref:YncE family protein n=1 Tax=Phenylobacterium sp. TaxID=1871053 RepID=UPI002F40ECB3
MHASRFAAAFAFSFLCAGAACAAGTGYHVIDRISGPDGGWDYVRVDEANNRVLLTHGSSVMAVNLATKAVSSFGPGQRLHDAMPVNGGAEVMVTNGGTSTVVFVNSKTGQPVATVAAGKGPDAAGFDPKTGLAMTMDHQGQITLIDPKAHKVTGVIEVGGDLEAAAADGAGKVFVNVENKNEVVAVDIMKKSVLAHYPLTGCEGPTGLAYDAADKLLIAACSASTDIVDARTGQVVQTLATGRGADGVAYDPKQKLAFVPAGRDGTLSVIKVAGGGKAAIVETVQTQVSARTIAVDERTGRVYLPAAKYQPATGGGRPGIVPGSFEVLVVGK